MISLLILLLQLIYLCFYYNVKSKSIEKSIRYNVNGRQLVGNYYLEKMKQRVNSRRSKF